MVHFLTFNYFNHFPEKRRSRRGLVRVQKRVQMWPSGRSRRGGGGGGGGGGLDRVVHVLYRPVITWGWYHITSLSKLLTRLQVSELVTLRFFAPKTGKNFCDRKIAPSEHSLRNNVKWGSNGVERAENVKKMEGISGTRNCRHSSSNLKCQQLLEKKNIRFHVLLDIITYK